MDIKDKKIKEFKGLIKKLRAFVQASINSYELPKEFDKLKHLSDFDELLPESLGSFIDKRYFQYAPLDGYGDAKGYICIEGVWDHGSFKYKRIYKVRRYEEWKCRYETIFREIKY